MMYSKYDCILGTPVCTMYMIILAEVKMMYSKYDCILGTPVCTMH